MKAAVVKKMIAAACAALATLGTWHSSGARGGAQPRADAKKSRVKELFVQHCARCHGRDGRGATKLGEILDAPDLTDGAWLKDIGDARLRASIAAGKGEMPAFAKKLTRREIAALAAYVRAFAPGRRDER